jgi:hypothetical protein
LICQCSPKYYIVRCNDTVIQRQLIYYLRSFQNHRTVGCTTGVIRCPLMIRNTGLSVALPPKGKEKKKMNKKTQQEKQHMSSHRSLMLGCGKGRGCGHPYCMPYDCTARLETYSALGSTSRSCPLGKSPCVSAITASHIPTELCQSRASPLPVQLGKYLLSIDSKKKHLFMDRAQLKLPSSVKLVSGGLEGI